MTIDELEKLCKRAEEKQMPCFIVALMRSVKGERCRVAPGLYGKVLSVTANDETVVAIYCRDFRAWLERRAKKEVKS